MTSNGIIFISNFVKNESIGSAGVRMDRQTAGDLICLSLRKESRLKMLPYIKPHIFVNP